METEIEKHFMTITTSMSGTEKEDGTSQKNKVRFTEAMQHDMAEVIEK